MKFEIKANAFCATIITVVVCIAVVAIQVYGSGSDFLEGWYPSTIVLVIHLILLHYIAKQLWGETIRKRNQMSPLM